MKDRPLLDKKCLLKKFPGKGGWTFTEIPEIQPDKNTLFGWVKVKGWIDDYELKQYKLMPMGNGQLFLPVKAAIRKKIKKAAGDYIQVILYRDNDPLEIPEEILACFANVDSAIYEAFLGLPEGKQKRYLDWIAVAKQEKTKIKRILQMIEELE